MFFGSRPGFFCVLVVVVAVVEIVEVGRKGGVGVGVGVLVFTCAHGMFVKAFGFFMGLVFSQLARYFSTTYIYVHVRTTDLV